MTDELIRRSNAHHALIECEDIKGFAYKSMEESISEIPAVKAIEISKEDFGTLCICALRYCMGRRTYMPSLVQDIVRKHFDDLTGRDIRVIADDKRYQTTANLWGDEWDKTDWLKFWNVLEKYTGNKVTNE